MTLVTIAIANVLIRKNIKNQSKKIEIRYSQSHAYMLANHLIFGSIKEVAQPSQSNKYKEEQYVKVVVADNRAYWIKNNTFYVADFVDGIVDKTTTKEVDTMSMDDVELKKMIFIVEALKEGDTDDYWRPGQSKF